MSDKKTAFERFQNLARAIIQVPKREVANLQRQKTSAKRPKAQVRPKD